jgi:hypothetical protein
MSRVVIVIFISILVAALLSIHFDAWRSHINALNMTNQNATRVNINNVASEGNVTVRNASTLSTQTMSALKGENMESISIAPNKCLGSALCPD